MITVKDISLLAAFLMFTAAPAWAQDTHHPTALAAAPQMPGGMPQAGGMGGTMPMMNPGGMTGGMMGPEGMMGGGMMGGGMMGAGMMGGAMMPMMGMPHHVEGWLAFLRTELKISDAQTVAWNQFADAVRANAAPMGADHVPMMPQDSTLPARLAAQQQMVTARLQTLQRFSQAVGPLYAALSDEQKKTADELLAPRGMM